MHENEEHSKTLVSLRKLGDPAPAAHPNSRFAAPAMQCPIIHPDWESPKGVPIDVFIFGGRRPTGVPLVYETFSWPHGIFTGACLKSEATTAAEHNGKEVMHDPMAMHPFMGYNFGNYLQQWLDLEKDGHKVPKIYHVNWIRKSKDGKFLREGAPTNMNRGQGDLKDALPRHQFNAIGIWALVQGFNRYNFPTRADWDVSCIL